MFEKIKSIFNRIKNGRARLQLDTINYEKIIKLMKEKGIYQEFENELNNFEEVKELMQNDTNLHGINHVVRVLFNSYAIMTLENVSKEDKKIIREAVKLHDIGRTRDGEDREHGAKGALKARKILEDKGYSKEEIDEICFIIKEHSLPAQKNEEDLENLPDELKRIYRYHLNIVKDADKLDRIRIGDLNPHRLSTDSAKRLIGVAKEVFEDNKYYYKNKMETYKYNEKEANKILEEINKLGLKYEITQEDIKKNYSKYKSIQDNDKLQLLKSRKETIPMDDFLEIINTITNEDIKFLYDILSIRAQITIQAIYDMGINKFMELKAEGKLNQLLDLRNYYKLVPKMTKEEKDLLMKFRKIDGYRDSTINNFYLYYNAIKNYTPEEVNMLFLINNDEFEYIDSKMVNTKGYKWLNHISFIPDVYKMAIVTDKKIDKNLILDIRQRLNIPLNVILTAIVQFGLFQNEEKIDKKDLEKILSNYYKFNLNVKGKKNIEQMKKLLLSLPENLDNEYETIIKECIIGKLKRFNLESFEELKNYKKICDEKILQEFQDNDNVNELKKIILETKIKDLDGIKRDIYFYKKYNIENAQCNEIINQFEKLIKPKDKQELLTSYQKLNNINEDFELDSTFKDIREELSQISKEDVITEMQKMKEKIKNSEAKDINGEEAIDITGTDFNLLISVIGSLGSPYFVHYYNSIVDKSRKFKDRKILFPILKKKIDLDIKLGIKRLANKRYKLDPLKNKQRCVSSIDQDFIAHVKSEIYTNSGKQTKEKLVLAYFPDNKKDISYMGFQDLMSIYDKERSDSTRKRVPYVDNMQGICNLKLQDLNASTLGDVNEVIVDSYPGAVMCFDEISNIAKKTANKFNLPILYIDTKKQFEIMKQKLDEYYTEMREQISQNNQISDEMFENAFNVFEQNNNIIHRAFKIANSFTFLDEDEYPKEQIIEVFNNMSDLVYESLKRCNPEQRKMVQETMLKEANIGNLRYGRYYRFIDFEKLENLVMMNNEEDERTIA